MSGRFDQIIETLLSNSKIVVSKRQYETPEDAPEPQKWIIEKYSDGTCICRGIVRLLNTTYKKNKTQIFTIKYPVAVYAQPPILHITVESNNVYIANVVRDENKKDKFNIFIKLIEGVNEEVQEDVKIHISTIGNF